LKRIILFQKYHHEVERKTIFFVENLTPKKNPSQTKSDRIESKSKAKID